MTISTAAAPLGWAEHDRSHQPDPWSTSQQRRGYVLDDTDTPGVLWCRRCGNRVTDPTATSGRPGTHAVWCCGDGCTGGVCWSPKRWDDSGEFLTGMVRWFGDDGAAQRSLRINGAFAGVGAARWLRERIDEFLMLSGAEPPPSPAAVRAVDGATVEASLDGPVLHLAVDRDGTTVTVDLDLPGAAELFVAMGRELARSTGAPKHWRRARIKAIAKHVKRMLAYPQAGDPAYWAHRADRLAAATVRADRQEVSA